MPYSINAHVDFSTAPQSGVATFALFKTNGSQPQLLQTSLGGTFGPTLGNPISAGSTIIAGLIVTGTITGGYSMFDNVGNVYLPVLTLLGPTSMVFWYCPTPLVGSGITFSFSVGGWTGDLSSFCAEVSNLDVPSPLDVQTAMAVSSGSDFDMTLTPTQSYDYAVFIFNAKGQTTYLVPTGENWDVWGTPETYQLGTAIYSNFLPAIPVTVTSCTPNSGSTLGGTSITNLAGTSFATGATVTFGGVPATNVVVVSSTQITCVTPANSAGTADIVVTNLDLSTGTLVGGFTYISSLHPTTTSISGTSNPSTFTYPVTFTVDVVVNSSPPLPSPAGSITIFDGDNVLISGLPLVSGAVQYTTEALSTGIHTITADYIPSGGSLSPSSASTLRAVLPLSGLWTNAAFTNRLALYCNPQTGPYVSPALGAFNPQRDMQFYVDGDLLNIVTVSFDAVNNRYLMFSYGTFNLQGVIQGTYHLPSPPFVESTGAGSAPFDKSAIANGYSSAVVFSTPLTPAYSGEWSLLIAGIDGALSGSGLPTPGTWTSITGPHEYAAYSSDAADFSPQIALAANSQWAALLSLFFTNGLTPAIVQSASAASTGMESAVASLSQPPTPGNTILAFAIGRLGLSTAAPQPLFVTDSENDPYQIVGTAFQAGTGSQYAYQATLFCYSLPVGSPPAMPDAFTVYGLGGAFTSGTWWVLEVSNLESVASVVPPQALIGKYSVYGA